MSSEVMFDVLLRSVDGSGAPTADSINTFYASVDEIEICRLWFAKHNMLLHSTPFGLSGSTTKTQFESVFSARLERTSTASESGNFRIIVEPQPPAELAEIIDQINIVAPPELF